MVSLNTSIRPLPLRYEPTEKDIVKVWTNVGAHWIGEIMSKESWLGNRINIVNYLTGYEHQTEPNHIMELIRR